MTRFAFLRLAMLAVPALLAACAGRPATAPQVSMWLTTPDRQALLAQQAPLPLEQGTPGDAIRVDPAAKHQAMVGFGAAITDASAWLIVHKLGPAARESLMRELFGPAPGIGLAFTRLTIGASDFSPTHYSYDDMPKGATDPQLEHFSIAPAKAEVLPVAREALAINPRLTVMATPWSPPGWMKTTDSLIQGTMKPEHEAAFAAYLRRTVEDFGAAGVPVHYLSIQNEPDFEPDSYPGMRLSAEQRARIIGRHVGPEFERAGLKTKLLDWDHNWDQPQQPLGVLADPVANAAIAGVAWHCYAGDVAAQNPVHDAHPDKDAFFTECSGGNWSPEWTEAWPWMMRNLIIGSVRNHARGVLLWNLALDEKYGPHKGGCGDCRGVVTIDSTTGAVTRNAEYYALGHLSRFVPVGARRIDSTSGAANVLTVAFADGRKRILLAFNDADAAARVTFAAEGRHFAASLPARSAATFTWVAPE